MPEKFVEKNNFNDLGDEQLNAEFEKSVYGDRNVYLDDDLDVHNKSIYTPSINIPLKGNYFDDSDEVDKESYEDYLKSLEEDEKFDALAYKKKHGSFAYKEYDENVEPDKRVRLEEAEITYYKELFEGLPVFDVVTEAPDVIKPKLEQLRNANTGRHMEVLNKLNDGKEVLVSLDLYKEMISSLGDLVHYNIVFTDHPSTELVIITPQKGTKMYNVSDGTVEENTLIDPLAAKNDIDFINEDKYDHLFSDMHAIDRAHNTEDNISREDANKLDKKRVNNIYRNLADNKEVLVTKDFYSKYLLNEKVFSKDEKKGKKNKKKEFTLKSIFEKFKTVELDDDKYKDLVLVLPEEKASKKNNEIYKQKVDGIDYAFRHVDNIRDVEKSIRVNRPFSINKNDFPGRKSVIFQAEKNDYSMFYSGDKIMFTPRIKDIKNSENYDILRDYKDGSDDLPLDFSAAKDFSYDDLEQYLLAIQPKSDYFDNNKILVSKDFYKKNKFFIDNNKRLKPYKSRQDANKVVLIVV